MMQTSGGHPSGATVADAIARRLAQYGVERVFGIPGTHNLELFRAFDATSIEVVSAHHEQGLGYAADAYARVTGKPAVVITTTGPGITNIITALATSLAASVPVLAIAPGIPERGVGRKEGWLHDLPSQIGLMSQLLRSMRVRSGVEAVEFIDDVARSWATERPAPAYLEVPFDCFDVAAKIPPKLPAERSAPAAWDYSADEGIDRAAEFLASSSSPLIIVGRGATNRRAAEAVRAIAERLQAPVMSTANAKGVLDERHALSLGVSLRLKAGKSLIERADVLLVVGSDLGSSEFWGPFPGDARRMVRVDVDAEAMSANASPRFALAGRSECILPRLAERLECCLPTQPSAEWAASAGSAVEKDLARDGKVYRVFHEHLQELTDQLDIAVTGDSSQATYFGTATYWKANRPNRFLYPAGYGTLGYAIPAAVGAALTGEVDRVVAITGEGGMLFSVQELATASEYGLPIITIVFTNGGYQEIRDGMESAGIRPVGVGFPAPDFVSLSRGFHVEARSIIADGADEIEFRETLAWALAQHRPTLIEVDLREIAL
ncbi:thiamine pyrophosphate-binding protein [Leucobacter sp. USCH14]|uniref:thiamine pyrophosphate-binding protein n=1 Tax=Leucobacter sp. USCH14 TaxID=3024838 RepID=UPI0030AA2D4C